MPKSVASRVLLSAKERHQGFADAIKKYPDLKIVGYAEGDWKEESGAKAMEEILKYYDGPIDLVFGDNDRMALGARKVLSSRGQLDGQKNEVLYLGVDALPIPDGGMENVRDGLLIASGIYPICGDELIELALKILRGEPYEKNNVLETSIVTKENANVLLLQYREVQKRAGYIAKMHNLVGKIKDESETQTMLSIAMCLFTGVVFVFLILIIHANRVKDCLNEELRQKNDELIRKNEELDAEKARVEQQRDQLEEQRDQLLDATTQTLTENQPAEPEKSAEIPQKNEFMEKFLSCVDKKLDSPTLSVEDISQEMCVSRVQLYRKVKSLAQKSPVEIIRERRLQRASELLQDPSLSISEVAYRVGFSAPSYFTKCYKEFFGKNPRS
ncbi:helix-turn-helix domain-containing protein [Fibrobacter sp. UWH5]|uniref:helix-turn-helix domain-containing protein n=1 Tax=Fibrobacter sp. UWH5 TaxID=1896211 RepID=UPI0009F97C8F|nr:helix-turn-helix domain-containing protein [Fibrobacter sp. UWH5]